MEYFELQVELNLQIGLPIFGIYEPLSKLVASALVQGGKREWHSKRGFKHYVFDGFGKAKSKFYPKGIYSFHIRSAKKEIISAIMQGLIGFEDKFFKIERVGVNVKSIQRVNALLTITPTVVSFVKDGNRLNWTLQSDGDIFFLMQALHNNLVRKYRELFGAIEADENFIELLEIKNSIPIAVKYKNGKIYANRFYIRPKSDEVSQKLAAMAIAEGLGEKNSLGFGFCRWW